MDTLTARLQASLGTTFTIERELGGGGMSRVFVARETALDRQVVIKTLDLEASAAGSAERFRREVKTIAKLQHPHIVPLLTAGGDDTLLWYAMPFVAGESLRTRLVREGALPLNDTIRVSRELLDALGFAHEHGIVHRDVKPENILLEGKHAVVADFGIAKAIAAAAGGSGLTSAGMALGTPAYMAPEQAMADTTTNHRADLYAAGAVMYEMLVGAPPFSGNAQAVVAAHLTAPIPNVADRRRDVPPQIAALIQRLLAKNPAERPQSAHEALASLEDVTTPHGTRVGVSAATTPNADAVPKVITNRQARAMVGVIVVALVAAAAIVGTWWARRARPAVANGADVIAVMPFESPGDTALARLGRDLVVTLSANLDGIGALRAVDATTVIMRAPQALSLEQARALGRDLRARSILRGAIVRDGALVRATASLVPVDSGQPLARIVAVAAPDSVRSLTDSLTNGLLRQIWRGNPPSPQLSEVTTRSNDALRAFLAGEAHFQSGSFDTALVEYARATAADSNFVQAFLRLDYVRSWAVMPADAAVRARLVALKDKLPRRDRDLLELRLANLPTRQRIDSGIILALRYPDYPTAQYEPADIIIHSGPTVGVPIERAVPFLKQLDALAPTHVDNAFHQYLVADALGDTANLLASANRLVEIGTGSTELLGRSLQRAAQSRKAGVATTVASGRQLLREYADVVQISPGFAWIPSAYYMPFTSATVLDTSLALAIRDGVFGVREIAAVYARGQVKVARGDFATGLQLLASVETSPIAPMEIRLAAARTAAIGAWMGTVPRSTADSILTRARTSLGTLGGVNAAELEWLDGLVGVASGDSSRVARATLAITDTTLAGGRLRGSLPALWREHQAHNVDALLAQADSTMAFGGTLGPVVFVHHIAIGRALTKSGDAARAEHYLQWTDARSTNLRTASVVFAFAPYTSYERGLAFEAAGDRARARLQLERFVDMVDKPPPAIKAQVDNAKTRLAKLGGDARR